MAWKRINQAHTKLAPPNADKLLSTRIGSVRRKLCSSSSFTTTTTSAAAAASSSTLRTQSTAEQKQSSSLWLISKAIFVCYSHFFACLCSIPAGSGVASGRVLVILNAANLHISRLGPSCIMRNLLPTGLCRRTN